MRKEKMIEEIKMENLIGKKLVGSRTGRIMDVKKVDPFIFLTIKREGGTGTLSIQFSQEEVEALQRSEEVSGFRIAAEEQTESVKTSGYEERGERTAAEKHLYVNKQIREALEKENTAMAKKVLNYLDKDLLRIVLENGNAFYFETPSHTSIPNYVHEYLVKRCEKILGVPYYLRRDERTSGYKDRGKRDGTGPYKDSYQRRHFDIGKRRQRGEPCLFETKDKKKSAQSDFLKKLKELTDKWYKKGIEAGKSDDWMDLEGTIADTLEDNPELDDPDELVWTDIESWEETDHFSVLYGKPIWKDIFEAIEDEDDRADAFTEVKTKFWEGYLQGRKEIGIDIYEKAKKLISEKSKRGVSGKSTILQKDSKIASLIGKKIASRIRTITGQDNLADRPEGLFTRREIEDLLKEMKTYYTDGEIESGKYLLSIEITKDSAGEEGWVYGWDLGVLTEDGANVDNWIDGDGYFYSDEELIDSLIKAGIVI